MATFKKFNVYPINLANGVYVFTAAGSTLRVCLSNTAPDTVNNQVLTDIAQIAYTNIVEAFPADTLNTGAENTPGMWDITGTNLTVTAAGGAVATFRYVILYDDVPTTPTDPLIGYWDYGSPGITLADTEVFNITFGTPMLVVI